jgi:hypothetical protein
MVSSSNLAQLRKTVVLVIGVAALLAPTTAGAAWTIQPVPERSGGTQSALRAVSCPTSTSCTAVGQYFNGSIWGALAVEWNGTSWSAGSAIANPGQKNGNLSGVSCATANHCIAAGSYGTSAGKPHDLAEVKEGTLWGVQTTTNPGEEGNVLEAVSCSSATACTAVGKNANLNLAECGWFSCPAVWGALGESWRGLAWSTNFSVYNPGLKNGMMNGVSCLSEEFCLGVGNYGNSNGETIAWAASIHPKVQSVNPLMPSGSSFAVLNDVSCLSGPTCFAVGYYKANGTSTVLAERLVSGGWSMQSPAIPSGSTEAMLLSIDCTSTSYCVAVGWSKNSGMRVPLAETWNGMTWTVQPTPVPAGSTASELTGVSCSAANLCTASGIFRTSGGAQKALIERLQ